MIDVQEQGCEEDEWPGVKYAYDFVVPSYQLMLARIEAADSRIQTLQTFIVTATFGLTAVISATFEKGQLQFVSLPFILAMALFCLAIVLGVIGRSSGGVVLTNPGNLYSKYLRRTEWKFKKDMVYFAGEHFKKNKDAVEHKHTITTAMTWLFLAEMALLLFWVIFAKSVK
jgi:hypothetical protein